MTDIFLRLNGYRLEVEPRAAHAFIVGLLASGDVSFAALRDWLAAHLRELSR